MSIFGRIVHPGQIDAAIKAVLQEWLPTYMAEVCGQAGLDRAFLATPDDDSYVTIADLAVHNEEAIPWVYIETTTTDDEPEKWNSGQYAAWWRFTVNIVVQGQDERGARQNAQLSVAAIRACLLQHEDLDGFAESIRWLGEGPGPDFFDAERSRQMATGVFEGSVLISDVVTQSAGPDGPIYPDPKPDPTEPYDDWFEVESTHIEVEKDELD